MKEYSEPVFDQRSFTCPWPSCRARALQRWAFSLLHIQGLQGFANFQPPSYKIARCDACGDISIWHNQTLVYPSERRASEPVEDMPDSVRENFLEAVVVFPNAVRASSALLRLSLQRLCIELGLPGENLNQDIGTLVERGLPEQIRQALDVVRVVGNHHVHPGQLDAGDNSEMAISLFSLINIIVEYMISNPKRIAELHAKLPPGVQNQIARRDKSAKTGLNNAGGE